MHPFAERSIPVLPWDVRQWRSIALDSTPANPVYRFAGRYIVELEERRYRSKFPWIIRFPGEFLGL